MLVLCGRLRVRPLHVSRSTAIPDVSPQVGSDRPTCMRLHYPLLLRATRPPDTDRAIRPCSETSSQPRSRRPVRLTRSVTASPITTHWGSSALRQRRHPVRQSSMETVINDGHRLTRTDETDRIAL